MAFLIVVSVLALVLLYLWHVDRTVSTTHPEAEKFCGKAWTKQEIDEAYQKAQDSPTDVKEFLFPKKNRRYVVTGGSGMVGGWIVEHLMMRGEDPAAIRILDLTPPKREEVIRANVDFVKTDVSDLSVVTEAFEKPWPNHVKNLPLTVFHCVAYINPSDRKPEYLPVYIRVNVSGTENVLKAAQAAKATCFVATSSSSICVSTPTFFLWPWQRWATNIYQFRPNAEPANLTAPLENFTSCYSWSKAQAEHLVRSANNPQTSFLTGALRPGHTIYGHNVENPSNLAYDFLSRGTSPTWLENVVLHFVNAQNVSIAHLAYEDTLLNNPHAGGKAYFVADPGPPIHYNDFYRALSQLAHPLTPVKFPHVPHVVMLLLGYVVETWNLVQFHYLPALPRITGDLKFAQPATLNMCSVHVVYTDIEARKEIGYRPALRTLEGFALAALDWNRKVEKRAGEKGELGKAEEVRVGGTAVPVAQNVD